MIDAVYVAGTIVFFALMILYAEGCDHLGRGADVERASSLILSGQSMTDLPSRQATRNRA